LIFIAHLLANSKSVYGNGFAELCEHIVTQVDDSGTCHAKDAYQPKPHE